MVCVPDIKVILQLLSKVTQTLLLDLLDGVQMSFSDRDLSGVRPSVNRNPGYKNISKRTYITINCHAMVLSFSKS